MLYTLKLRFNGRGGRISSSNLLHKVLPTPLGVETPEGEISHQGQTGHAAAASSWKAGEELWMFIM